MERRRRRLTSMGTNIERTARLVIREADYQAVRSHLLRDDCLERACFLLLGKREVNGRCNFYVHRLLLPDDSDYSDQSAIVVEPSPEYVLHSLSRFTDSWVPGYLHVHSHPFSCHAAFSGVDDSFYPGEVRSLANYLDITERQRRFYYVRLVWGQSEDGFTGECFDAEGSPSGTIDEIQVIGPSGVRTISRFGSSRGEAGDASPVSDRFQRQVEYLGEAGQCAIEKTRLAICGVGGLGSFVLACAKGIGFRHIAIIDHDTLEESNLNRFQGATWRDVGRPKVEVLAESLNAFDLGIDVAPVFGRVEGEAAQRAILDADFIINCLDDDSARMETQVLAARHLKPLLDLGSGIVLEPGTRTVRSMGGQAILYVPGGPCLVCQGLDPATIVPDWIREVHQATGYIAGTDETPPSVVTHNAVVAGMALQLVISYVTGFSDVPTYLEYDMLHHQLTSHRFAKRPDCPICGEAGIEGKGDDPLAEVSFPGGLTSLPSASGDSAQWRSTCLTVCSSPTVEEALEPGEENPAPSFSAVFPGFIYTCGRMIHAMKSRLHQPFSNGKNRRCIDRRCTIVGLLTKLLRGGERECHR